MKTRACAKINLGLNIVKRRPDGYHDLQTVFYPVPIFDDIEILADTTLTDVALVMEGQPVECRRAWEAVQQMPRSRSGCSTTCSLCTWMRNR